MSYLRSASFGALFVVTFTIAATCQLAFSGLGLLMVATAPGMFNMNGQAATNPAQALGVLAFLLVIGLFMNAGISAIGSGVWILVRRALPGAKPTANAADVF
ncbi:hypothetical protein [Caulobacter sp. DWR2-3-1b2]|uniref:hypothetical protein n=1 Tax=unclassified Caulobacter TaxID=2648921 RepID=UPI0019A9E3F6|nr:hypothetical protein [Caulobacter sp.]